MTGNVNEEQVEDFFVSNAKLVSDYLSRIFSESSQPETLFKAMNYSLLGDGKRLRPLLCLATASTFGVDRQVVMPVAAALEMVHCYSLIHDDLPAMDDDDLRRGKPTNHKVFGEASALLAGDGLLTYAFEVLSQPMPIPAHNQIRMIQTLARAAGVYGMVGGQQADLEAEHSIGDAATLRFIHEHKTGKLIQASVLLGALFADLEESTLSALADYGKQIGLAFQIIDDYLDVIGDSAQLGKIVGVDQRLEKLTYPRLYGLENTRQMAHAAVQQAINSLRGARLNAPLLEQIANYIVSRDK
jgi:geranylgeranyl diphosphate synthase type II